MSNRANHLMAAVVPLFLLIFLGIGSLSSCSEDPPTGGKDSCDTCHVPCDTCEVPCDTCDTTIHPCDTCGIDKDSAAHAFVWTEYTIPGESNLTGCWVFSGNRIYAIGTYLYRFDGTSWVKVTVKLHGDRELGFPDFTMFAIDSSDYWIVSGGILDHIIEEVTPTLHYAEEFRPGSSGLGGGVTACWGTSSKDMFFVGKNGSISHFDGTTFTKMASPTTKDLRSVWGTIHNDVWACGFNSSTAESVLLHFDGLSWTEVDLNTVGWIGVGKHALQSIFATDSAGHKIVIASGSLVWRRTDNNSWRSDSGYVPNALGGNSYIGIGVRGNNVNDFMAVGGWGFAAHWNGRTWKKYDELFNYSLPNYGASGFHMKGNTACIVGGKSGSSWIAIGRRKP